ncbi:hypothetical protein EVAR_60670_1 [Eumeta japonica]|uniref:Uncharacterized protein n=1 Tax=Eumeta variegata TaxID=151549 RepID=A0A4C1ZTA9_EUMVA|nr:hypothetical protein EVAR_60670_1 [Eumeta japonica]
MARWAESSPLPHTVGAARSITARARGGVIPSSRPEGGVAADHMHRVGRVKQTASHSPGRYCLLSALMGSEQWLVLRRGPLARQGGTDFQVKHQITRSHKPIRNKNWSDLMEEITPTHKTFWKVTKALKSALAAAQ